MTVPDRDVRRIPSQTPVTLVNAGLVVTADPGGGMEPGTFHGLYHRDQRILSRYLVTVDGVEPNVLTAARRDASSLDTVMATSFNDHGDARGVLVRHRRVTGVVEDRYVVHRLTAGPPMELRIRLAADFGHLIAVKGGSVSASERPLVPDGAGEFAVDGGDGVGLRVSVRGDQPSADGDALVWTVDPEPGSDWQLTLTFAPHPAPSSASSESVVSAPLRVAGSDHRWERAVRGSVADLASLRMQDGGERFTAAGAPWFMALFGRDSLLTSHAALPLGADQALDTLEALARWQGQREDLRTLEQPGRILHELRTGVQGVFGLEPGEPYYGTADATPLFVMVLADAARWGADPERVRALLPAARRAVAWCSDGGDIDGDGFVEAVPHDAGIENQGWKDSGDSMVHRDGSEASRPISLVEVQAYVHGALTGLAYLEDRFGDGGGSAALRTRADVLRERFLAAFWSDEVGGLVLGLDADKRPMEVATSNMGHALWTDILDPRHRAVVAARVTAPDLFADWGIRTLGSDEVTYSPLAYHRGSIWPHDSSIIALGLSRSGARGPLLRLVDEMLGLAEWSDYRLPELLSGTDRTEVPVPVPYPVACSPQAWSAAAPLLLLRSVLGLEPDVPAGELHLSPCLPEGQTLHVSDLLLGSAKLSITVGPDGVEVDGAAAAGLTVITS